MATQHLFHTNSFLDGYAKRMFSDRFARLSALAVFAMYSKRGGFGAWSNNLGDFGMYGVINIFVFSAQTLTIGMNKLLNFSYGFRYYLLRRFTRIFPMNAIIVPILWSLGGAVYYREIFNIPCEALMI